MRKTTATPPAKPSARAPAARGPAPARKAASRQPVRPSLRPVYAAGLRTKALAAASAIERDEDPAPRTAAFADVVVELTEAGMGYFFVTPLEEAKAGFVVRQGAEFGMAGALRVMAPVIRTLLGRLDGQQLRAVAGFVREILA